MKQLLSSRTLALLVTFALGLLAARLINGAEVVVSDWPTWRGPTQDGKSPETGLIDSWDPHDGENVLWKNEEAGTISTPIVMRGKLYVLCRDEPDTKREGEKVLCLDAATGEKLWENRFNVFLSDVPAERVGWSSVVGDPTTGHVYALGVCGYFQCLDGETGETLWSRSLSEEFGLLSTYGGRTNIPVVFEDLVIASAVIIGWGDMAKPAHRFLAFNKQTGEVVWFAGTRLLPEDTTYSTPVLTSFDGEAAMVFASGDGGIHALQPRTGQPIWQYPFSLRGVNTTPLVDGDRVYIGHSEENLDATSMGSVAAIDGTSRGTIAPGAEHWLKKEVRVGKSTPVLVEGRLYAVDDSAGLWIFDAETGEQIGRRAQKLATMMRSSLIYADGKIFACSVDGRFYILKPTADGVEIAFRTRLPRDEEVYGSPIVSHGRLYLPTTGGLYCLGDAERVSEFTSVPVAAAEPPVAEDRQPAHVQLVPAEVRMKPGERQSFRVRLFNARGELIEETDTASFAVEGPGDLSPQGELVAPSDAGHQAAYVTAQVGDLSGTARVRIIPPLPWKFDFADGQLPITWVGARYRHIALDHDLWTALKADNPLAAQLYIYLLTGFINNETDVARFDDRTNRRTWTALREELNLLQQVRTREDAQREFDPALERLQQEGVIERFAWGGEGSDVDLTIHRGLRRVDGNGVMTKITTIPKGTRSQAWMGHPELSNYTIQADVMGTIRDGKTPDIGLIAQRYTLDLMGSNQQLQIRTWTPQLFRMSETVPFAWQPDQWYTMKLRAAVEEGRAVLRGKVWPRGEAEPDEWHITAVDEAGNTIGSPGLFGNASNAEIFLDNITVTPNE